MKQHALICLLFCCLPSMAQTTINYPQGYFRNPLKLPISLAGGFAECRPNHFHTGIDLKTNQQENQPVLAAADGYVSRISIAHTGYGNCLYLTHPNGYTTVYGHLNDFFPALQKYTEQRQYALQSWNLDINLTPDQFPVSKGQQIAWSGNTGGSTGPHLHFEIRETASDKVLNALLFGLPFTDTRAPELQSLAIYNAQQSIYEQDPILLDISKKNKQLSLPQVKFESPYPQVRLGVLAKDYTNNSHNWLGIYKMTLYIDGKVQLATRMNAISFSHNRMVNAYADYKTKEQTGEWYQGLYKLPYNNLDIYTENINEGKLDLSDQSPHRIRIEIQDPMNNQSVLEFTAQYQGVEPGSHLCPADAQHWDCSQAQNLSSPTLQFQTSIGALYDDICFRYKETVSEKHFSNIVQLHTADVPLQTYCPLSIRLNQPIPFSLRSKLVFVHQIKAASLPGNHPQDAVAAKYEQGWATAEIRTFGNYYVDIDTIAPQIIPLQKGHNYSGLKQLRFRVIEDQTKIKQFEAQLNGQWLRFVRSGNIFTYTFDEKCPKGKHTLILSATDDNDNTKNLSINFSR